MRLFISEILETHSYCAVNLLKFTTIIILNIFIPDNDVSRVLQDIITACAEKQRKKVGQNLDASKQY